MELSLEILRTFFESTWRMVEHMGPAEARSMFDELCDLCVREDMKKKTCTYLGKRKISARFFKTVRCVSPSESIQSLLGEQTKRSEFEVRIVFGASWSLHGFHLRGNQSPSVSDILISDLDGFSCVSCGKMGRILFWSDFNDEVFDVTPSNITIPLPWLTRQQIGTDSRGDYRGHRR